MTIAIGIFDLLTYAIPGALYVVFFAYLALRLHWVVFADLVLLPSWLLVIGLAVLSYLVGYVVYPVGAAVNKLVPQWRVRRPRQEFVQRVPVAAGREYVLVDPFLLLSVIQLRDKDAAVDVMRLRAAGLMLRNAAPPLLLGFVAAVVEVAVGHKPLFAVVCGVILGCGFFSLLVQGRRLGMWASLKTLEVCFWLPDVDEPFRKQP